MTSKNEREGVADCGGSHVGGLEIFGKRQKAELDGSRADVAVLIRSDEDRYSIRRTVYLRCLGDKCKEAD